MSGELGPYLNQDYLIDKSSERWGGEEDGVRRAEKYLELKKRDGRSRHKPGV